MHLGHVYQKLNLTRRTKLSAALGNRGTPVGRFSFELSAPAFTTLRRTLVGRMPRSTASSPEPLQTSAPC